MWSNHNRVFTYCFIYLNSVSEYLFFFIFKQLRFLSLCLLPVISIEELIKEKFLLVLYLLVQTCNLGDNIIPSGNTACVYPKDCRLFAVSHNWFPACYTVVHIAPWEVSPSARHTQELHLQGNCHQSQQTEDVPAQQCQKDSCSQSSRWVTTLPLYSSWYQLILVEVIPVNSLHVQIPGSTPETTMLTDTPALRSLSTLLAPGLDLAVFPIWEAHTTNSSIFPLNNNCSLFHFQMYIHSVMWLALQIFLTE